MKICNRCKETKELSEFCKNKRKYDGYNTTCKKCVKEKKQILRESPLLQLKKAVRSSIIIENRMLFKEEKRLCSMCGNIFSINERNVFYCIKCRDKNYKENKEKIAEQQKEYREKYKEQIVKQKKEYYEENKEKINEQKKEHYKENKEKIAEQQKEYYENNKEKRAEKQKEYYEENKEKIAEKAKKYYEKNKEKAKKQRKEYYERTKNIRNNTDSN